MIKNVDCISQHTPLIKMLKNVIELKGYNGPFHICSELPFIASLDARSLKL